MKEFDENNATADELWDYCMREYNNRNFIAKKLLATFFSKLREIVNEFDPGARILEVGCGAGESSRQIMSSLNGQYFEASDYDGRYVQKLISQNPGYKVSVESVYSLNRLDNEFDHVIMTEVLEHLTDYRSALKELFRVAGNSVIISVPNEPIWRMLNMARLHYLKDFGNTPGHVNHFSKSSLIGELERFGKVRRIYTPLPWIIAECVKK